MIYDTTTERYSHLRGFTDWEIQVIMWLADCGCDEIEKARANDAQTKNGADAPSGDVPLGSVCGLHRQSVATGGATTKQN